MSLQLTPRSLADWASGLFDVNKVCPLAKAQAKCNASKVRSGVWKLECQARALSNSRRLNLIPLLSLHGVAKNIWRNNRVG